MADSVYIINSIQKLVQKTTEWLVMLKCHTLLHRLVVQGGEEFKAELEKTKLGLAQMRASDSSKTQDLFNIRYWRDDSSPDAAEFSGWTRTYSLYVEELVSCCIAVPSLTKAESSGATPIRAANMEDLMDQLPKVQGCMRRLIDLELITESLSQNTPALEATTLLLKEASKLYRLATDGIINLIDKFFDMNRVQALKALEVYIVNLNSS